ncbi:MAG: hypothetical protein GF313_15350 [Caldithrix sp.]|nr:hypothetical protein [Caldithrix sp.]
MRSISFVLNYLLPVAYLAVVVVYYRIFFHKQKELEQKTTIILSSLLVVHFFEISIRHLALNTIPLSNAFDSLSFLGFSILVVYLIIELTIKNKGTGLFILSFAFVTIFISAFNHQWQKETNALLSSPTFAIHASLTLIGYTALALSAIFAVLYIMQNRNMKSRRFGIIYDQLPAINYLERMSIRSVAIGIILLGVGILLGHWQAAKILDSYWPLDVKVIVSDIIWVVYLITYIFARLLKWRGRWMAYLAVSGFILLVAGSLAVVLLSESFHKFY